MGRANTGRRGQPKTLRNSADIRQIHEIPAAPDYFNKEERKIWDEMAAILIDRFDLTSGDLGALEVYCSNLYLFRAANRRIAAEGLTIEKVNGMIAHPLLNPRKGAEAQIMLTGNTLGLSPHARRALKHSTDDTNTDDISGGNF